MAEKLGEAILYLRTDDTQLDRGIDAAKGKSQSLDSTFKQSATTVSSSMDKITGSVGKTEAAIAKSATSNIAAMRSQSTQISQFAKVLAADMIGVGNLLSSSNSPFVIPTTEAPKAGAAIRGLSLVTTALGTVMASAAGVGVAVLVGALVELISKSSDTSKQIDDLVTKLKEKREQTILNEQAQRAFDRTVEGSIDAMAKLTEEIAKQNRTLEDNINLKKAAIAAGLANVVENIGTTSSQLATAVQQLKDAERLLASFESGDIPAGADPTSTIIAAGAVVEARRAEVNRLRTELEALTGSAERGARALRSVDFPLIEQRAKDAVDPIASINRQFDDTAAKAKQAGTYTQEFANNLEKQREAALEAAKANERLGKTTGELAKFIMPVSGAITSGFGARTPPKKGASSFHPALDIAAPIGTPVKAAAGGVVIYTGRLGGLGNVVVVDHGGGTITEYGHLSKILTKKGATVGQGDVIAQVGNTGISTGPHLDYRVKVGGRYVDPRKGQFPVDSIAAGIKGQEAAEKAAEAAKRAAERITAQNDNFAQQSARLDAELLSSRGELLGSVADQARIASQQVEAERRALELAVQKAVNDERIRDDQGKALIELGNQIATQRQANIEIRKFVQQQDELQKALDQDYDLKLEGLRYQADIARTAKERRDIELQIVDLIYKQREDDLRIARAKAVMAQKWEEVARIDDLLAALPDQKKRDEDRTDRQNKMPAEEYYDKLPKSIEDLNEALQRIEVGALQRLNDELLKAVMNSKSLKDFWKNLGGVVHSVAQQILQDLMDLAIKMFIIKPIMDLLGVGTGSAGSNFAGGFATGGMIPAGMFGIVGERGPEPVIATPHGARVLPNSSLQSTLGGGSGRGPSLSIVNHNDFRGADPASVAAINSRLDQMEAELPGRVVSAWQDARQRFVVRV